LKIVLFDIDGTLLSTGGAGFTTLREVFRETFSVDDAVDGIEFHGRTDPHILDSIAERWLGRLLTADEYAGIAGEYTRRLPAQLDTAAAFRVLPGAAEIVQELFERQATLGLATGNLEATAFAKLRRAGMDRFFAFGGFGSDSPDRAELTRIAVERARKRAGTSEPVLVVGDTIHDVRCALAAGALCLGVATGNADEATLRAEGATWTVPGLDHPSVRAYLELV
jgi:phosphoglycolate phosphatase-like HAD superfamily hydrolase